MVKKLFKHEIVSYLRLLVPVYLILLGVGAMGRVIQSYEADTTIYYLLRGSSLAAFFVTVFAAILLTTIFCILRFYKNFFTGEGYLTFTLPITTTQHLLAKLGVALLAEVATLIVILLSASVLTAGEWFIEILKAANYLLSFVLAETGALHFGLYVVEFILLLLMTVMAELLMYYMCISVGQTFRKNRVLAAVGVYFGIYMITQALSTVVFIILSLCHEQMDQLYELIAHNPIPATHIIFGICILLSLLMAAVYYLITHFIIRKKLNLE